MSPMGGHSEYGPGSLPHALAAAQVAQASYTFGVMLRLASRQGVQRLQFSIAELDGIGIQAAAIGQTDAQVKSDSHGLTPLWVIPARSEKDTLIGQKA